MCLEFFEKSGWKYYVELTPPAWNAAFSASGIDRNPGSGLHRRLGFLPQFGEREKIFFFMVRRSDNR